MSQQTIAWTITQWRENQRKTTTQNALTRIVKLLDVVNNDNNAFVTIATPQIVQSQWSALQKRDRKDLPLYGVPFVAKDNIDVIDFLTTAACPAYLFHPTRDATVITLLKNAGAICIGKANMDQFATGLVGTRSPYGVVPSSFSREHACGGSSSGSGHVVGKGWVPFSLGTDTAGSGRVPAHLNNIIGLKPSCGAVSCHGVVPACQSLDCVSIFGLTLDDVQLVASIITEYDAQDEYSRAFPKNPTLTYRKKPKLACPSNAKWFDDEENPKVFSQALKRFETFADVHEEDFTLLYDLAACLYEGPWVAERYAALHDFFETKGQFMDKVVYTTVAKAKQYTAADCFAFEHKRQQLRGKIRAQFAKYDALIVPTAPLNPRIDEIFKEPFQVHLNQGTYTNFVNLADMSAIAIPAGFRTDGLPFGISLVAPAFEEYALVDLAKRFLSMGERSLGATNVVYDEKNSSLWSPFPKDPLRIACVGAHCSGMRLNYQITDLGGVFERKTRTSARYRMFALGDPAVKPGLKKVDVGGMEIEMEIWKIPKENIGKFLELVPHPLAIGTLELVDGSQVHGFVCEEIALTNAPEITHFQSWRSYVATRNEKQITKILIANRGEIAVRITKTLQRLEIRSVAIYSVADKYSQHVLNADESVFIDGTTVKDTYLSIEKIVRAARATKCDAIIPGYGFLAENPEFVDACDQAGIIFIGPSSQSMRDLGLKHRAKQLITELGIAMVPGSPLLKNRDDAVMWARKIGFPVILKNTAGGGGIGMEKCDDVRQVEESFARICSLGDSYFNDDRVFVEKCVVNARHVEVQVFGDGNGRGVSLGTRDCTLQRRNQKVIEETTMIADPVTLKQMEDAAETIVRCLKYKNAGTVEFIYDVDAKKSYFLEVNTRLQVEHCVTEMVTALDLVEAMIRTAEGFFPFDQSIHKPANGCALEARIYAEVPLKNFKPSAGQLTRVQWPENARVDTWIRTGIEITADFDPLLAKIIVHGESRDVAIAKLVDALATTRIDGVQTNLKYLQAILQSRTFTENHHTTKYLDRFQFETNAVEVFDAGFTSVQDYPGRTGHWHVGVPPSGPMDEYAFRVGNQILGNDSKASGLEITLKGPTLKFHKDTTIVLTGGTALVTIDDKPVEFYTPRTVRGVLTVGRITNGCRVYLLVKGGFDVPEYLGSQATFELGKIGGVNGRGLKYGDVLYLNESNPTGSTTLPLLKTLTIPYPTSWTVRVMYGPHTSGFFTTNFIETFLMTPWKVHHNSNKMGVRLRGPAAEWVRETGGEAGIHPSNIHDYVYGLGCINFTGNYPVILTCDGPSLGGFVCPFTVISADMWMLGQVKAGDSIQFVAMDYDEAVRAREMLEENIQRAHMDLLPVKRTPVADEAILRMWPLETERDITFPAVTYRQVGDRYLLVEYGPNKFDLNISHRVYKLAETIRASDQIAHGVVELNQGVRSLLIEFNRKIARWFLLDILSDLERSALVLSTNWRVASRIIHLPFVFEDAVTLAAVERYRETIKSDAPYLPNNVDFLARINDIPRRSVDEIVRSATYMVLGLGDVYLGAPCAIALDPRHRLLGTKYSPSRSYTPTGTVGLGGAYLCIYGMDSPGGYQLIGRTIPIWDKFARTPTPNLLELFDQIRFYRATEAQLADDAELFRNGLYKADVVRCTFDYKNYLRDLAVNRAAIDAHEAKNQRLLAKLSEVFEAADDDDDVEARVDVVEQFHGCQCVHADLDGKVWKVFVKEGDCVRVNQALVALEAMKSEVVIAATCSGCVVKVLGKVGDVVRSGDVLVAIK